jgi:hypothetical protein
MGFYKKGSFVSKPEKVRIGGKNMGRDVRGIPAE